MWNPGLPTSSCSSPSLTPDGQDDGRHGAGESAASTAKSTLRLCGRAKQRLTEGQVRLGSWVRVELPSPPEHHGILVGIFLAAQHAGEPQRHFLPLTRREARNGLKCAAPADRGAKRRPTAQL